MESFKKTALFLSFLSFPLCGLAGGLEKDTVQTAGNGDTPLVYIDCNRCDYNHIRREITFVNYIRDPDQADVHIFITDVETGGGGTEFELSFLGQGTYKQVRYTFTHTATRNETWDETREELNRVIKMGMAPYLMQTSMAPRLSLLYENDERGQPPERQTDDPWDHWVFEVYAGAIELEMESNQTRFDSRWGIFADRVTDNWKLRMRPYFNYDYVEIQQEEDKDPVVSRIHRHGIDSYALKSISEHWSVGIFGNYITRNDRNLKHRIQFTPGIEYSVLPYAEATRKAITFVYQVGFTEVDYYEETIFNRTRQSLFNQQFSASVEIQQPWGEISGGLVGSHYFHEFNKRRAEFFGRISVRLVEGLLLGLQGEFSMIQDQLSLPLGDTSLEDVLLQQRELATDFSLLGSISISYTFGSDFANVVNTRF